MSPKKSLNKLNENTEIKMNVDPLNHGRRNIPTVTKRILSP